MRHYTEAPYACMEMRPDDLLISSLRAAFMTRFPRVVIESGTYQGQGSTRTIGDILKEFEFKGVFNTIETSPVNWATARVNLANLPFVNCLWGCSVDPLSATAWLLQDDMLNNPDQYPNVYVDMLQGAAQAYAAEVKGYADISSPDYAGTCLLQALMEPNKDAYPLIVLDSAGGIGYMEFNIVRNIMGANSYLLLLDDIEHVKHYRSYRDIRNDSDSTVLATRNGWALIDVNC